MKKRKIFAAALALLMLLQLFAGCNVTDQAPSGDTSNSENDNAHSDDAGNDHNGSVSNEGVNTQIDALNNYNAVLYDNAVEWINQKFIKDHPIAPEKNLSYPTERVFIIDGQEKYDQMFLENVGDFTPDFSEQMIVAYTFYDHNRRENILVSVNLEGNVLKIIYEDVLPVTEPGVNYGDSCQPYQRWFVVKLDNINVDSVIFEQKK